MKKILFVINTLGIGGGAEMALLELMRNMDPRQFEIHIFVLLGQGDLIHRLPDSVKLLNEKYDDCSTLTREGKKHLMKHVLRTLLSHGTLLKMTPYLLRQLFGMLRRGRVQPDKLLWKCMARGASRFNEHYDLAVAFLEGGSTYYVADFVTADKKAAFLHVDYQQAGYNQSLDGDCYDKIDCIFAVSDEVRESFLRIYPGLREQTKVFHNLLNQEAIRERAKEPGGFSDDFDGFRILTVGRLTSQKAVEISVEALRLLKKDGEQVRWYVLGEGDQRRKLEAKIKALGLEDDFLLPGTVENPYPYMAQADLYVHATRFEGKAIAVQEAQTLGCTILVSDCSGNREQVIPEVDGMLCELTPEAICRSIKTLLHDEEKRRCLGLAASKKQISDVKEIEKLLELLR